MNNQASNGPLSGLRVLEIGHFIAAPFCTRLLGDLGAEIVKIEPLDGDPARKWGAQVDGNSLWWSMHARNKKSVALNLKSPQGNRIVLDLVAQTDVVVENFRPGQLARLGLSDDQMRAVRENIIIAHVSGYGQNGPDRDRAAFGVVGEAIGGLRYLTNHAPGTTDLPPVRVGVSIGDSLAGLYAAFGVVAALWQRDRRGGDGRTRTIDVALTESVLSMMEGMLPEYGGLGKIRHPTGSRIPTAAPTSAYPTADGPWMLIAANSEPLFARLCALLGRPDLPSDARFSDNPSRVANVAELDRIISEWTAGFAAAELEALLKTSDIPSTRVYTVEDICADPQYQFRKMIREVDDPHFEKPVLHAGVVPHIPDDPGAIRWPGPSIGQHTDEVLAMIGRSAHEVQELRSNGVVQ